MLEEQEKDMSFIQKLYVKYGQNLWGYVYHLSGNKELSDDVLQTVFLNMMKHTKTLQNIKNENQLKAYLNTATRNTYYNLHKKQQRYTNTIPYEEMEKEASIDNPYFDLENADYLQSMIATLSKREQDLLSLYYFVGLSTKETAEVMNLSVTNTKVTLHNARKKLKKRFNDNE